MKNPFGTFQINSPLDSISTIRIRITSQSRLSGRIDRKSRKRSFGLYGLDEFSVLENLILSLGYRHEWVTYDLFQESPFLKDKVREGEPAWNVGLDYLFGKKILGLLQLQTELPIPRLG